jgi:hypothetical protein
MFVLCGFAKRKSYFTTPTTLAKLSLSECIISYNGLGMNYTRFSKVKRK